MDAEGIFQLELRFEDQTKIPHKNQGESDDA